MTGMLRLNCNFMRACDTDSEMYSKCMVSPLMRVPIEMMASKFMPLVSERLVMLVEEDEGKKRTRENDYEKLTFWFQKEAHKIQAQT